RIVVGRVLGPASAAEFSIYVQISQLIHYVPSSVFAFSFPVFSRLAASSPRGSTAVRGLYRKLLIALIASIVLIASTLAVLHTEVIHLFAGGAIRLADSRTMLVLIVGFSVLALNIVPYYVLLGLGKPRSVSLVTTGSIVCAVGLTPLLVQNWGL